MNELSASSHSRDPKAVEIDWATSSPWHLIQFFERKSTEDPVFDGYDICAKSLDGAIKFITESEGAQETELLLKPRHKTARMSNHQMSDREALANAKHNTREKLFEDEDPRAAQAFILLAYKTTDAETLATNLDEVGQGDVIVHGRVGSKHIYFVEHYGTDEKLGRFMSWTLMNEMPDYLLPTPKEREEQPFITSGEIERARLLDAEFKMGEWDAVLDQILEEIPKNERAAVLEHINQPIEAPEVLRTLVQRTMQDRVAA